MEIGEVKLSAEPDDREIEKKREQENHRGSAQLRRCKLLH